MLANKIFIDLYSTSEHYKQHDDVSIILLDCGIYTIVKRKEMLEKCMNHGCFIDHISCDTPEKIKQETLDYVKAYELRYVSPKHFRELENKQRDEKVATAFAYIENLILHN